MSPRRLTEPLRTCEAVDAPLARFAGISPEGEKLGGTGSRLRRLGAAVLEVAVYAASRAAKAEEKGSLQPPEYGLREGARGRGFWHRSGLPRSTPSPRKEFFDEKGKV